MSQDGFLSKVTFDFTKEYRIETLYIYDPGLILVVVGLTNAVKKHV